MRRVCIADHGDEETRKVMKRTRGANRVIVDTLAADEARGSKAGKQIVLPRSFLGGDRDVQSRFLDTMTLVRCYDKPDYFVTMTCNPYWSEILEELLPGQIPQDCLEVVARVYKAKLHDLHNRLTKKKHFGEVAAYVYVIEFQKRGLPHEHFLLVMTEKFKLKSPDDYDK